MIQESEIIEKWKKKLYYEGDTFHLFEEKNISVKFGWKVKQGGRCGERREDKRRKIIQSV